jgi:tetratricopeptide (TPR) repeat protein
LKYWDSALEYYTRAIQCGSMNLNNVSTYFANRAAVQILKKNWGHASRDCLMALELNPDNVKAMYRAAKSFYEVRKLPEGIAVCVCVCVIL